MGSRRIKKEAFIGIKGYKRRNPTELRKGLTFRQRILRFITIIKLKIRKPVESELK